VSAHARPCVTPTVVCTDIDVAQVTVLKTVSGTRLLCITATNVESVVRPIATPHCSPACKARELRATAGPGGDRQHGYGLPRCSHSGWQPDVAHATPASDTQQGGHVGPPATTVTQTHVAPASRPPSGGAALAWGVAASDDVDISDLDGTHVALNFI
jgi:hypothetical protein